MLLRKLGHIYSDEVVIVVKGKSARALASSVFRRLAGPRSRSQPIVLISSLFFKGENPFPVVLHADNDPALLHRFVVQRLDESADLRVRQPQRRTVTNKLSWMHLANNGHNYGD